MKVNPLALETTPGSASGSPPLAPVVDVTSEASRLQNRPSVQLWKVVLLVLAVLISHGLALNADFYMDDEAHILTRETGRINKGVDYEYRWVTGLAWDAIYSVFGASSVAFHAFNLALHLAVTIGVLSVGRRLISQLSPDTMGRSAEMSAFAGALIFATHPLLTEGVNYAQNASLQLVTLFTLSAIGCSLRFFASGRIAWILGVIASLVLSAYTKEVGLIYCGLSVALTWVTIGWERSRNNLGRYCRFPSAYLLLGAAPILAYFLWYAGTMFFRVIREPMWMENFFTQGRLFWSYARLMVWPTNLCADHLVPFSGVGLADPWSLIGTLSALLLGAVLMAGVWFNRGRTVCLLLLTGLIPLLMRFLYVNKELFVEYRAYPAFPWIALAAGCGVAWLFRRVPKTSCIALFTVIGVFATASARRSMVWSDAYQLAVDNIRHYPNHIRARTHLQRFELNAGNWKRVLELRDETAHAFETLKAFNQQASQVRKYEASMPYRGYMCSEHFVTLVLAETDGSQMALQHANEVLDKHRRLHPEFFQQEGGYYEIVEQMVDIQNILRNHGAEYDQRRQTRAAESRQSQAAK